MKHMNTYCTKYFSQVVSFKPSSYSSGDKAQMVKKIKDDNFAPTSAKID